MLLGLGAADPVYYGPEEEAGDRAVTQSTGASTITIYPPTIVAKASTAGARASASILDTILPKRIGADGKERIWGLPPAVAYALAAVILAGGGLLAYQQFARGGRRVANPPRRRRNGRAKRARYKR
jgi:hypothetical protein